MDYWWELNKAETGSETFTGMWTKERLIITLGLKMTHSASVREVWRVNNFPPAHIINNFEALLKN